MHVRIRKTEQKRKTDFFFLPLSFFRSFLRTLGIVKKYDIFQFYLWKCQDSERTLTNCRIMECTHASGPFTTNMCLNISVYHSILSMLLWWCHKIMMIMQSLKNCPWEFRVPTPFDQHNSTTFPGFDDEDYFYI